MQTNRRSFDMRKLFIAMVAVAALTGAACSSSSDTGSSPSQAAATGATGASGATGSGCTAATAVDLTGSDPFTVTIQGLAFHPDCFAAKSASAITIQNKDSVTHTFTIDGTQVDVSIPGGTTFNGESAGLAPGTYPFHCKIHSTMTGTVIVS
jgi:plastocyanin